METWKIELNPSLRQEAEKLSCHARRRVILPHLAWDCSAAARQAGWIGVADAFAHYAALFERLDKQDDDTITASIHYNSMALSFFSSMKEFISDAGYIINDYYDIGLISCLG